MHHHFLPVRMRKIFKQTDIIIVSGALDRVLSLTFVEAAALRSAVLRYASAPIATCVSFSFFGVVAFSEYFFVPIPLSLCMESTSYVRAFLPSGVFLH